MPNRRFHYAVAGACITPDGTTTVTASHVIHGLQSCSNDANLNLEKVFEIGQSSEYEQIENLPDVSISLSKVLDGYCPMYLLATNGATGAALASRGDIQSIFRLFVYPDDYVSASGTALQQLTVSGSYINSVSYTFPVDGNFTEEMTLGSSSRNWKASSFDFTGEMFDNTDTPLNVTESGGVQRREDLIFSPVVGGTVLPADIAGITSSGTNETSNGTFGAAVQNISISVDMGREDILELGRFKEYAKLRNPVVDVNTEIEIIAKTGDLVDISSEGGNVTSQAISINTRDGLAIDLGTTNKLQSVSLGGFDAGGGNANATYSYSNANFFTVQHPQDITTALRP
jgi:hypothetical protein